MDAEPRATAPFEATLPTRPSRPGARRRAAFMLLVATLVAAAAGGAVFLAVLWLDALTAPADGVMRFFYRHTTLAMLAACSPLFAAMLVGYGYMQRAIRRRAGPRASGSAPAVRR